MSAALKKQYSYLSEVKKFPRAKSKRKSASFYIISLTAILTILALFYIGHFATVIFGDISVQHKISQIKKLQAENRALKREIAEIKSHSNLIKMAQSNNMIIPDEKNTIIIYNNE